MVSRSAEDVGDQFEDGFSDCNSFGSLLPAAGVNVHLVDFADREGASPPGAT